MQNILNLDNKLNIPTIDFQILYRILVKFFKDFIAL
jgi:hypothetical protein